MESWRMALTWSIMDRGLQRRRGKKNKEEKEKKKAEKMMPGLVVVDWMAEKFDSPTHPKCPRESLCSVVR
jgi:hypothetical protein